MTFHVHEDTLTNHKSESGKAIFFTHTYDSGFHRTYEWFPLSVLNIGEPNECGWSELVIPDWLLKKKGFVGYAGSLKGTFEELED